MKQYCILDESFINTHAHYDSLLVQLMILSPFVEFVASFTSQSTIIITHVYYCLIFSSSIPFIFLLLPGQHYHEVHYYYCCCRYCCYSQFDHSPCKTKIDSSQYVIMTMLVSALTMVYYFFTVCQWLLIVRKFINERVVCYANHNVLFIFANNSVDDNS